MAKSPSNSAGTIPRPDSRPMVWVGVRRGDVLLAISLAVVIALQIAAPDSGRGGFLDLPATEATLWAYVLGLGSALPLILKRRWPVPVFAITLLSGVLYMTQPYPRALVIAGPLFAMYSAALMFGSRRSWWLVAVGICVATGASAFSLSTSLTVQVGVAAFGLFAATALLGNAVRSRREIWAEQGRAEREEAQRRIEEERMRIAREIHDIMGHSLTMMTLQSDAALAALRAGQSDSAQSALVTISETGRASLKDLRSTLDVLTSPDESTQMSPVVGIEHVDSLVDSVRDTGIEVDYRLEGDLAEVPTVVAIAAYRIVQESLTNMVRHSGARHASVAISPGAGELKLEVIDDGRFDADHVAEGRGVRGMRERVAALGGTIEIGPDEWHRFRVDATIPFSRG